MVRQLLFLIVFWSVDSLAFAQSATLACEINPVTGCETYMNKAMGEAGRQLGEGIAQKVVFAADLAATRAIVARECRSNSQLSNHPERIQQVPHFIQLLNDKDFYFLALDYDMIGWGEELRQYNENIDKLTSGGESFDGGPRPAALWKDYIDAVNQAAHEDAKSVAGILENAANLKNVQTGPKYRRYVIARNLTEFNAAGCNLTSDPIQLWQDAFLIDQPWKPYVRDSDNPDIMHQYYEGVANLFGVDALGRAASIALRMPKTAEAMYQYPDGSVSNLMTALLYGLDQDDRSYALKALVVWEHTLKPTRFEEIRKAEAMLVAAYGEDAIPSAGHTVRNTKWTPMGGFVGYGPGWRGIYPGPAVLDTLAKNNPQGYIRAILAYEHQLTDKAAVDAAYSSLITSYGPKAVAGAGSSLLDLLAQPSSSVPAAFRALPAYTKHYNGGNPGVDAPLLYEYLKSAR